MFSFFTPDFIKWSTIRLIDWPIFNFGTVFLLKLEISNWRKCKNDEKSTRPLKVSIFCAALDPLLAIVSTLSYQASFLCWALQSDKCLPYLRLLFIWSLRLTIYWFLHSFSVRLLSAQTDLRSVFRAPQFKNKVSFLISFEE